MPPGPARRLPRSVVPQSPGPGQESVWDYPRPPRLEPSTRQVVVRSGSVVVAQTNAAWRVLETSHPPTWYLPRSSMVDAALRPSAAPSTTCEWKGPATYWDVLVHAGAVGSSDADPTPAGQVVIQGAVWSYERPTRPLAEIAGCLAFLPSAFTCEVDGERVRPQEGGFYGGWITDDVVGPFKGIPGSCGW